MPADNCGVSAVLKLERPNGCSGPIIGKTSSDVSTLLCGDLRKRGQNLAVETIYSACIAYDKNLRPSRNGQVRCDLDSSRSVGVNSSHCAALEARMPAPQTIVPAVNLCVCVDTDSASIDWTASFNTTVTPRRSSWTWHNGQALAETRRAGVARLQLGSRGQVAD